MFTSFSLLKSRPVLPDEAQELYNLMDIYSKTETGRYLNYINFRAIQFYWCDNMAPANGIMGAWLCWLGKRVYLMPGPETYMYMAKNPWLLGVAPTLAHELVHCWQYKRSWLLYILACLPVVREITIEKEANVVWRDATKFFENLSNLRTQKEFAKKMEGWKENDDEKTV
jgi:hypothetical protein